MFGPGWVLIVVAAILLVGGCFAWRPVRGVWSRPRFQEARQAFHWQRERLEAKFFDLAGAHRKPGAPRWLDCDFDDDVAYVRNRYTGELSAFVAVTIALSGTDASRPPPALDFEDADDWSDLDVERPLGGDLRGATAVFRFDRDRWVTEGRVVFNLSPSETIRFYQRDLEMVGNESPRRPRTV
ncbi:MAG: hypothetical protein JW809_18420 [Pirellulales bacterium]|nr:hypothetical protein [Pirellulales bacterium]